MPKNWIVCRFRRGLGKKEGGMVFLKGGLLPQCTLWRLSDVRNDEVWVM